MKKIINFLCLLIITLSILSCGDIINSDKNINVNTTNIFNVKSDQEKNVIMPLKIGNKWFYNVTEYYFSGAIFKNYVDSVSVISDTLINSNRWFKVHYPMLRKDGDVFMTNTDLGLWYQCLECNNQSYLLAQFPNTKRFLNDKFLFSTFLSNGEFFKDSCLRFIDYANDTSPIKKYSSSNKYTQWLEFSSNGRIFEPFYEYNFVPEIGLIKHRSMYLDLADKSAKPLLSAQFEIVD